MAKKASIDITIGKDGKVKIKVHGVSGKECTDLTDAVAKIVGREESRMFTAEYRQMHGTISAGGGHQHSSVNS